MSVGVAVLGLLAGLAAGAPPRQCGQAGEKLSRFEFEETHMASPFKIVLYSTDAAAARRASRAAFDRIAGLNRVLSDYDPDSELSRLAQSTGGPPVPASADLFEVLERSKEMYDRSGGAFDVTIAPVGRLWRRARRDRRLPDNDRLAAARLLVGSDKMVLDSRARTVRLTQPGMRLDAGGIAKGFAAQKAIDVLKAAGIGRALVAAAGDIVVGDPPPDAQGWKIAIAPLDPAQTDRPRVLLVSSAAVSTSGDAERYVVINGHRYSHIIDPKTGLGVEDRASVTVIARDGTTADALETTVYLLGPERGLKLVDDTPGAAAIFVRATAEGVKTFESARFKDVPNAKDEPKALGSGAAPLTRPSGTLSPQGRGGA
jgi:FAD:protein FMN transferase